MESANWSPPPPRTGGVVSSTRYVRSRRADWSPHASSAQKEWTCVDVPPQPSTDETSSWCTTAAPHASEAVALASHSDSEPGPLEGAGHSTVASSGGASTGGVVST